MKKINVEIAFIIAITLIVLGVGIYFYGNYQFGYSSQNADVLSALRAPSGVVGDQVEITLCNQIHSGLEQYFACKPYAGWPILLISVGLVIVAYLIIKTFG